jgi:hypothetical protein
MGNALEIPRRIRKGFSPGVGSSWRSSAGSLTKPVEP